MPVCVAFGCGNRSGRKSQSQKCAEESGSRISFHSFPKDPERRAQWITAVRRENWQPSNISRICSVHFKEDDFDKTSLSSIRLRDFAVPSIFPAFPFYLQKSAKPRRVLKKRSPQVNLQSTSSTTTGNIEDVQATPNFMDEHITDNLQTFSGSVYNISATELNVSGSKIPVANETIDNKCFCYEENRICSQIRTLQRAQSRNRKTIKSMKLLLKELRNNRYLDEDNYETLRNIPTFQQQILTRQLQGKKKLPKTRKYEAEIRSFALTLHYYSPAAYEYVRQKFDSNLPHPKTLYRWYKNMNGNPGFTEEAFAAIKVKSSNSTNPIYCTLVMDEMAIYSASHYDGSNYFGYIDMGTGIEVDTNELAKSVLVFLLVAINENWKIPVAYFLCNTVKAVEKKTLVLNCIKLANDAGVKVVALTFDGTTTNLATVRSLGCELDANRPNTLKTHFQHPDISGNIYVILDPCHMLKLVRNVLGDLKNLQWENKTVSWEYIENLQKLQEFEGIHLANKLKKIHVNYKNQKMKVKLASQLFSNSVADAMDVCREDIKLESFSESEQTSKFIRLMNNLFDILNTKNAIQYGFKAPLNKNNFEEEQSLATIPTYRLSQDHLEVLFGVIRRHGGSCNNPTPYQFRSANEGMSKTGAVQHAAAEVGIGRKLMFKIVTDKETRRICKSPMKTKECDHMKEGMSRTGAVHHAAAEVGIGRKLMFKIVTDKETTGICESPMKTKERDDMKEGMSKTGAVQHAAAEVGIGRKLMFNIVTDIETTGICKSPKKTRERDDMYSKMNEDDKKAVRRCVHSLFKRNEMPTLDKVLQATKENVSIPPMSRSTLFKVLKKLGFVWEKRGKSRHLLPDRDLGEHGTHHTEDLEEETDIQEYLQVHLSPRLKIFIERHDCIYEKYVTIKLIEVTGTTFRLMQWVPGFKDSACVNSRQTCGEITVHQGDRSVGNYQ
ncbi:hypothetical protein CBL_11551 [Carabus blaptoides fortunei]